MTRLINARSGEEIATAVEVALTRAARRRGLLERDSLDPAAALVLSPCIAVHTAFMRFAIDVIFVDKEGHVTRTVKRLVPWRIAASFRAHATIELPAGALDRFSVAIGDRLFLASSRAEPPAVPA
jgi:uncharacterized membrane protein (UPF0127 family)